jgi:cytochrome P450
MQKLMFFCVLIFKAIVIDMISSARNSDYFKNPELFDPDRFGPERAEHLKGRKTYRMLKFGGGSKQCPGEGETLFDSASI